MARTHPLPPPPLASPSPPQPGHGFIPEDASSPRKHTGLAMVSAIATFVLSTGLGLLFGVAYWFSECFMESSCPQGAESAWITGGATGAALGVAFIVVIYAGRRRLRNLWGLLVIPPAILGLIILYFAAQFL